MAHNSRGRGGRIGYCVACLGLHRSKFRGVSSGAVGKNWKTTQTRLRKIWAHNLEELCRVLDYNIETSILLYRMGSDLFPMALQPRHREQWEVFREGPEMAAARWKIRHYLAVGGRLTMHPKLKTALGSPSKTGRRNSLACLEAHGEIMEILGLPRSRFAPINIHLGGGGGGQKTLSRIRGCLETLSEGVRGRLVFENEDKSVWTWQNIARAFPGYPITLDAHHHRINNLGESLECAAKATGETWGGEVPLRHAAEGAKGPGDREHGNWVAELPAAFLLRGKPVGDIEIEAKMKDLAVLHLKAKYRI